MVCLRARCWVIGADALLVIVKLEQELPHMHFSSVEVDSRFSQNTHQLFTVKAVLINSRVLARLLAFPPPFFTRIVSSFLLLLLLLQPLVLVRTEFLLQRRRLFHNPTRPSENCRRPLFLLRVFSRDMV